LPVLHAEIRGDVIVRSLKVTLESQHGEDLVAGGSTATNPARGHATRRKLSNVFQVQEGAAEGYKPEEKAWINARAPRAHVRVQRVSVARTCTPCEADIMCAGRYVFSTPGTPSSTLGHWVLGQMMCVGLGLWAVCAFVRACVCERGRNKGRDEKRQLERERERGRRENARARENRKISERVTHSVTESMRARARGIESERASGTGSERERERKRACVQVKDRASERVCESEHVCTRENARDSMRENERECTSLQERERERVYACARESAHAQACARWRAQRAREKKRESARVHSRQGVCS